MRRAAVASTALALLLVGSAVAPAPGAERVVDSRSEAPAAKLDAARRALRTAVGGDPIVGLDRSTARPRVLARRNGFLTPRSSRRPVAVALGFVRAHGRALGVDDDDVASLALVRSYRFGPGTVHLQWEQSLRGIPLSGAGVSANVAADGRLINLAGAPRADLRVDSLEPRLSALDALLAAAGDAGVSVVPGRPSSTAGPDRLTTFADGSRASLTVFDGTPARLAWRVLLYGGSDRAYDAIVDARTGATLYRANLVRSATARVFDNYPGAPRGGGQVDRVIPDAWFNSSTTLSGNNAYVYSDPDDANAGGQTPGPNPVPADEVPPSAPGAWLYSHDARPASSPGQNCPPTPGCSWNSFDTGGGFSWRVNRAQAGTQLFYYLNVFHDHLRDAPGIGFGAASRNLEGGDRVIAQFDDGATTDTGAFDDFPDCAHLNNAFVIPLPDGTPVVMQLYLWSNSCTPATGSVYDVNPADDAAVVYHEYTHAMTNRLVTDAFGMPALTGAQPEAMDEGFADWYAFDLLNARSLELDTAAPGELVLGRYEHDPLRTQGIDCPVAAPTNCPGGGTAGSGGYTYGDFGEIHPVGVEPHADGEIWGETLWDLRARLISAHGAADGINRARALVTDGLRLAPDNPTFLDVRNAILQADVNRGFGDRDRIWAVFAARGMGLRASTFGPTDGNPIEDFSAPPPLPPPAAPDTTAPRVSRVSLTRRRFAVGSKATAVTSVRPKQKRRKTPRGTTFRFRLSERATVRIVLQRATVGRRAGGKCRPATRRLRGRPRCTRYVSAGTLVRRKLRRGARRVNFSGRVGRRALRLGVHRASLSAVDASENRSKPRRLSFKIIRR
jgi:extracellular elastinolytic metalloproteinase